MTSLKSSNYFFYFCEKIQVHVVMRSYLILIEKKKGKNIFQRITDVLY